MAKSDYGRDPISMASNEHGRQEHHRIFGLPKSKAKLGQIYRVSVRETGSWWDFDGLLTNVVDECIFVFEDIQSSKLDSLVILDTTSTDFTIR